MDIGNGKVSIDKEGNIKALGNIFAQSLDLAEGKSAGSAKILAGQASVSVSTTLVDTNSKIIVTFTSDYAPASRYVVTNKAVGEGFTVSLDTPVASDADFDWVVIGAREVSSQ